MTREEREDAINCFENKLENEVFGAKYNKLALEALEQASILDKIRAEILKEKECAYADFERYKVDYLGQDWEDVQDSLPQDDFRYGMERCIDIIDKYKAEFEAKDKVSQG